MTLAYLLMVALSLSVAGCRPSADPYVLAAVGAWHLPDALPTRRGIELAVEEVNARGGIHGRPLSVVFRDDSTDGVRAVAIAQQLVADRHVIGVIGNLNSGALIAAAKMYDGRLPAISPTAVSPELDGLSSWVFRLMPSDSLFTASLAGYARALGGRAGVLYDNNSFGRGGAEIFRRHYTGQILGADPIEPGSHEVEPHITFFRRAGADLLLVVGGDSSGLAVVREAHRQGYRGPILGTDSWAFIGDPARIEGAYVGMRFSAHDQRPEVVRFAQRFRERFGVTLPENGFPAFAYDATRLFAEAIEHEGPDRAAVRHYLASLRSTPPFHGVTGAIRFGQGGAPAERDLVMMRVTNGVLLPITLERR